MERTTNTIAPIAKSWVTPLTNQQILERYRGNISFKNQNLRGANLEEATLTGAKLEGAKLEGAHLRGAHLEGAHLEGAHLRGADLEGAHLRGAYLQRAHLDEAPNGPTVLTRANLRWADLTGAVLTGAVLTGANLEGADLTEANLEGADIKGANFEGAIVKDIKLENVKNLEKAKNLHLNRKVVKNDKEMTIIIESHGSSTSKFFLVPDNVKINTKSDVGTVCAYDFFKSKNFILYDLDWIKHSKGNIIPDFSLNTQGVGSLGKFGIYVLKGGPLTCDNYEFINDMNNMNYGPKKNITCEDNNDDFLRITFDKILLSDLIKGLKKKFPEYVKINIYDISCNALDLVSAKQIQCFNLTGDLSKKTTPTETVTTFEDGGRLKRLSFITAAPYEHFIKKEDDSIEYRTDHTKDQDFSAFREYDYSKEIEENIINKSLLTEGGKEKMEEMLTETFNMKDVCFLLVCVYLFVENKGNEKKLFDEIEANTEEQKKYKAEIGKFFTFTNNIKFGRRRSQRKIKRRIDAKRRSIRRSRIDAKRRSIRRSRMTSGQRDAKRRLRSIKKRGVST